jgi:hypothetical protein
LKPTFHTIFSFFGLIVYQDRVTCSILFIIFHLVFFSPPVASRCLRPAEELRVAWFSANRGASGEEGQDYGAEEHA